MSRLLFSLFIVFLSITLATKVEKTKKCTPEQTKLIKERIKEVEETKNAQACGVDKYKELDLNENGDVSDFCKRSEECKATILDTAAIYKDDKLNCNGALVAGNQIEKVCKQSAAAALSSTLSVVMVFIMFGFHFF